MRSLLDLWAEGPLQRHFVAKWASSAAPDALLASSSVEPRAEPNESVMRSMGVDEFLASSEGAAMRSTIASAHRPATASFFPVSIPFAKGSFGTVHFTQHFETGQPFAMKRLSLLTTTLSKESRVWMEHRCLTSIRSRFLLNAFYAFVDAKHLVFVTRLMPGGTLSHSIRKQIGDSPATRFYLASIVLGLEALHSRSICYRDLKGRNVLLDARGHARLSDFGLCVDVSTRLATGTQGTKGHVAPEQYASRKKVDGEVGEGYGTSPDLWALGTLAYAFSVGKNPFKPQDKAVSDSSEVNAKIEARVLAGDYAMDVEPFTSSPELASLVRGLLTVDPRKRLGVMDGLASLKAHKYFQDVNWERLENGEIMAPLQPENFQLNKQDVKDINRALPDWTKVSDKNRSKFEFVDEQLMEESYARWLEQGAMAWIDAMGGLVLGKKGPSVLLDRNGRRGEQKCCVIV
ncbi:hypothetical protein AB1Y20_005273 [Prymnesium parvum]|uniref:Non-specific serine/threonine protein kinase n=1 Tax=Prymnesium parvum TaxID=97485 RepID=A0AB34J3B5_PRYPA